MEKFTEEYIDNIRAIIAEGNVEKIQEELKDLHPADIAELYQELSLEETEFLNDLLDKETAADALMELDEDDRRKILKDISTEVIAKEFIDHLDTDDAVDLIRDLDEDVQEEVLSHIDDVEQAGDIVDLLKYDEDTAGGIMGTEMVIVNENWSMPECVKEMRRQAEEMDEIYYVYVVDDDERLRGVFPLKKMITHPSVSKIKHVMKKEPVSVHTDDTIESVAQTIEKYNLVAVPVVDSIGRLVGRITVDDVMDEVREQAERDYQMASGISQDVEVTDTVFTQTAARLPWLLIGMVGGIATSIILGKFEGNLAQNAAIALFIPLIGGMGGNVGIQSSAIVVQSLANKSLEIKDAGRQILKEVGVSFINACMISLLVLGACYLLGLCGPALTMSVALSLFTIVVFSSVFGACVPIALEKCHLDPAIATGPFITITNDIIGMLIYMGFCALLV
ncbi:MAG: magnesium transporter [Coprobacter sp.]|nr:magnesium transporter [Coprobacter sp.]